MNKIKLDAADIRILSAVQRHGQLSKTQLAEIVNLSPTPCWIRLKKLIAAGLIRGYQANVAIDRICDFTQVIVTLSLSHHRKADFERFEKYVWKIEEITECFSTGGGMDYILNISTPSLASFQELMDTLLGAELGIERYMTYIVTRKVKCTQPDLHGLIPTSE